MNIPVLYCHFRKLTPRLASLVEARPFGPGPGAAGVGTMLLSACIDCSQGAGEVCNLKVKEHDQINRIHVVDTHGGHIY